MYLYLPRIYRQIALVSYGNEFLSGAVDSELLDRHPLLFTHFPILRDLEQGYLLAGSASHFLLKLKSQGLERISLHSISILSNHIKESKFFHFNQSDGAFCILCHFPQQQFKALVHCDEKPLWQEYNEIDYPIYSDYNNYHDSVENYILVDVPLDTTPSILEDLKPISWQSFFNEYQNHIYHYKVAQRFGNYPIPLTENNCYEGDSYQYEEQFPVLPYNLKINYASILMHNAARLKNRLDNESHIKNENGEYWYMTESEKFEFDKTCNILNEFHMLIFKYSANQYQSSNINHKTDSHDSFKFISKAHTSDDELPSILPILEDKNISPDETIQSFSWLGLIKFLWSMLWCYCALWTLAYFAVHWGNLFILSIAFFYAIYKITKNLEHKEDH